MAFDPRQNLYRGVNAHLQSYAQHNQIGAWKMWHNAYINDIFNDLQPQLPRGYSLGMITSLQISEFNPDTGERIRRRPEPDLTIYGAASRRSLPIQTSDESYLTAILIYQIREFSNLTLVTRIEVLSPTNKPPGGGYIQYVEKRDATLTQQIPLIEIDFLHETQPVPRSVPSYPDRDEQAHAYTIYVSDTRAGLPVGDALIYGFDVDEVLRPVMIPLAGKDAIDFDFFPAYNQTYSRLQLLQDQLDYTEPPLAFETYAPADQERIQARMAAIASEKNSTE